jgi:acetyl esterase
MPPNARALEFVDKLNSADAREITELDPVKAREEDDRVYSQFFARPEPTEKIENRLIRDSMKEIPIRVYWPKISDDEDEQDLYPIIVFFHGGGWVLGGLDSYDELCSMLANRSEALVISVDYRLAPEHKFPAAVEDCFSATRWAAENSGFLEGDKDTLIVAGESAGGNLAAVISLMAKEKGEPQITAQLLINPVTDFLADLSKYSKDKFGPSKETMEWFYSHYLRHESEMRNPFVSPQYGDLHRLPPAIIVTAECDPLREQNLEYKRALEQCGVKTTLLDYPGTVHGFMQLPTFFPEGRDAIEKVGNLIKKLYVENVV